MEGEWLHCHRCYRQESWCRPDSVEDKWEVELKGSWDIDYDSILQFGKI